MKYKSDLQSIRALTLAKRALEWDRMDLYNDRSGAGYASAGKSSKGMTPVSKVERAVLHMDSVAAELEWKLDSIKKVISSRLVDMIPVIIGINDPRYRYVLTQRYIRARSWADIVKESGYERRYLLKLHYRALLAYERVAADLDKPDALPQDHGEK